MPITEIGEYRGKIPLNVEWKKSLLIPNNTVNYMNLAFINGWGNIFNSK